MPSLILPQKVSKIIFGLGNPGTKYHNTKHNVGTLFCDYLCQLYKKEYTQSQAGDYFYFNNSKDKHTVVFKSPSYMNLSGIPFKQALEFCDILPNQREDIIIVHDDLDSTFGKCKIKTGGSPEGHNGLKSIINKIGTQDFLRLKLAISRPDSKDPSVVAKYVLSKFKKEEEQELQQTIFLKAEKLLKTIQFT